ncbi:MAG: carboxypeptidase-like regulatory domain-containing protein, partial [Lutibacter sp.]
MRKIKNLLIAALLISSTAIFAQTKLTGKVVDESNQPLPGASLIVKGTKIGASTDFDGNFSLETSVSNGTLQVSFIGYGAKDISFKGNANLGTISLEPSSESLSEIVITQVSFAIDRKTPVAVSTISASVIENKLGAQEFPEILKSTPGIYATKQGGGYGDSRVNLRGFESANIAVMVNGVPVNDMEWGGVYWSNWAGLGDVTRSMQVQRGLGASKVAAPSLGGSINIVTRSTDAKEGGAISYGVQNDGYSKASFSYSTGLTEKGWAISLLGSKTTGDGYIQGTEFKAASYFVNISKKINDSHELSFTAFGAPQWHNQRNNADKLLISEWQKQPLKYRYNASYGFDMNGQRKTSSYNVYHKPQMSLNHLWTINEKSNLYTVLYASIGDGSGTSGQGLTSDDRTKWYGTTKGVPNSIFRAPDGTFDYGAIYELNQASDKGSKMVMSKSVNQHKWFGAISTYTSKIGENIDFFTGVDLRY